MSWVSVLILAAGKGERVGLQKLLLPWKGKTIIEEVIETFLRTKVNEIIVVLGRDHEILRNILSPYPVKVVYNSNYATGKASSIKRGLQAIDVRAEGIMIAMGDMPLIEPQLVDRMIDVFLEKRKIVVPVWEGKKGHPVLFPRAFQAELMKITGDEGGKGILQEFRSSVFELVTDSPTILMDVDTFEDYERIIGYARLMGHFDK
jgi:molybdenum cofactor cytidylyltransferase